MPALLRHSVSASVLDGANTTLTIPSTVNVGEFMLGWVLRGPQLTVNEAATTNSVTLPSGWIYLNSNRSGATATVLVAMYFYKVATASDPGSTFTIPNSAATGVMQAMGITTWDSTGLIAISSAVGTGNGTSMSWPPIPAATQRAGDTLIVVGGLRSSHTGGYNNVTYPAAMSNVVLDLPYNSGVVGGQVLQGLMGYGTIPPAKVSNYSGASQTFHNTRSTYTIEIGPSIKKGIVGARAYYRSAPGSAVRAGQGRLTAKSTVRGRAQPPTPKQGHIVVNARMAASGQRTKSGHGDLVVNAFLRGAGETEAPQTALGTATLTARVRMSAAGYASHRGAGRLTAHALFTGSGAGTGEQAIVPVVVPSVPFESSSIGPYYEAELLASTAGYTEKGVTLAAGQGMLRAGVCIAKSTVDNKHYAYDEAAPNLTPPIGILRTHTRVPDDTDTDANVLLCGIVHLDALSTKDIERLKTWRGAKASVGRNLLVF